MQSDGNSSCGDVAMDSFNKTSRDEDNISDRYYMIFFHNRLDILPPPREAITNFIDPIRKTDWGTIA